MGARKYPRVFGSPASKAQSRAAFAASESIPTPTPIPTPLPSPSVGVYQLPSNVIGGEAGKGFTCTGLARDPSDGTWWIGNDGRARGGSTPNGSLVHVSADFSTVIAEYPAANFGLGSGHSCQGVAIVGERVGALFKKPGTSTNVDTFVLVEKTGAMVTKAVSASTTADYNGLGYDPSRGQLISTTATGISWRNVSDFVAASPTKAYSITGVDQVHYVASDDAVITTGGANGSDGLAIKYRASDFTEISRATVPGATAIEGLVQFDDKWAVASDEWFHNGTGTNCIRVYGKLI